MVLKFDDAHFCATPRYKHFLNQGGALQFRRNTPDDIQVIQCKSLKFHSTLEWF